MFYGKGNPRLCIKLNTNQKFAAPAKTFQLLQRKLNSTYKNKLSQELSSERSCCVASFLPLLCPTSPYQERSHSHPSYLQ